MFKVMLLLVSFALIASCEVAQIGKPLCKGNLVDIPNLEGYFETDNYRDNSDTPEPVFELKRVNKGKYRDTHAWRQRTYYRTCILGGKTIIEADTGNGYIPFYLDFDGENGAMTAVLFDEGLLTQNNIDFVTQEWRGDGHDILYEKEISNRGFSRKKFRTFIDESPTRMPVSFKLYKR